MTIHAARLPRDGYAAYVGEGIPNLDETWRGARAQPAPVLRGRGGWPAFTIYGLAEYYRATQEPEALAKAIYPNSRCCIEVQERVEKLIARRNDSL